MLLLQVVIFTLIAISPFVFIWWANRRIKRLDEDHLIKRVGSFIGKCILWILIVWTCISFLYAIIISVDFRHIDYRFWIIWFAVCFLFYCVWSIKSQAAKNNILLQEIMNKVDDIYDGLGVKDKVALKTELELFERIQPLG